MLANGQAIIQSYETGYLNQHLFNFIGHSLTKNMLSSIPSLAHLNKSSIADWSISYRDEYKTAFLTHFEKCLELNPSYYMAFQGLNNYYYSLKDYDNVIKLNRKTINAGGYEYNFEYNNHIAKAHYMQQQLDSCKHYLELTINEIDLAIQQGDDPNGQLAQKRAGIMNQLNQVNQSLSNPSSN